MLLALTACLLMLQGMGQTPTITGFAPASGGRGTTVVITGTNFTGATAVRFGAAPALSFTVNSATQITAVVGNGASGPVVVTRTVNGQSATFFTFINAAPTISGIAPATQIAGGAITITGTNFGPNAASNAVFIGGVRATVTSANTGSITCTVPAGAVSDFITVVNLTFERSVRSAGRYRITHAGGTVSAATFGTRTAVANAGITGPVRLRMADMDNDGKADVVFTRSAGNLAILRNNTSGSSVAFANPIDASARTSTYFDVGDISNDGKLDVIETNGTNTFVLRPNTSTSGSISFGTAFSQSIPATSFSPAYFFRGVELFDLDEDGQVDMTAAASYANTGWFVGRMQTYSGTTQYLSGTNAAGNLDHYQVATGDLNADGKPDLVSVSSADFKMVANVNKSVGNSIQLHYNQAATGISAVDGKVLIADLNADGKNDVLARVATDIRVWRNTTATAGSNTLTFGAGQAFAGAITNKTNFAIGDLNGDGLPDLVVATSNTTGTLQLYINTSTASDISFGSPIAINGVAAADVAVADVNNDNRPDLIVTETAGNSLGVYLWTAAAAVPTITSFTPTSGPIGTSVTITGTNFTGASGVTFGAGNTPAQSFTVNSATQITATVAAGTTTGQVRVTTPGGTATAATNFTVAAAVPTITNTNPTSGAPGTAIIITGTHFTGATAVTFSASNTNAASFTVNSATQITATIAAGTPVGPGPVRVTTPAGTASLNGFVVTSNLPAVSNIVGPISGALNWIVTGGLLTINGTNFTGTTAVTIGTGNTPVTSFTVVSATQITCRVSGNTVAGSGPIRITNAAGTGVSANYTIVSGLPVINSFTPASGSAGTTVVINGSNLFIDNGAPNPTVTIGANNTPATVLSYSANNLSVSVGAGTTTGPITITTTYGTVSSATNFTASAPVPTITALNGNSGPAGSAFVIEGTNFNGATAVTMNNVAVASFTVFSNTQILANIAANNTTGLVRVITPAGTAVSATPFTVTPPPPPANISFTPTSGPVGTTVTISGASLITATAVTIGGNNTPPQSWSVNSQQLIVAVVAPGTTTGPIRVTNPSGTAVSAANFTVTGTAPAVTGISPLSAPAGATVTITGTNLAGAQVSVSGQPFSVLSNNGTTMTIQVPTQVVSGVMQISTAGGSAPATGFFTFQTAAGVLQHRAGQLLTLTGPSGAASYQWQVNQGSGFVNLANAGVYNGVNTRVLTINNIATSATGYRYRLVINGSSPQPELTLRFVTFARANGAFSNTATWEGGLIPDLNTDVVVDDVSLNIDVNATIRTMTVAPSTQVQVLSTGRLTIRQ